MRLFCYVARGVSVIVFLQWRVSLPGFSFQPCYRAGARLELSGTGTRSRYGA